MKHSWSRMVLAVIFLFAIPGMAAPVLLVTGSTTLNASDGAIRDYLQSVGHSVTIRDGVAATPNDAAGKSLVIISSTVSATDVNIKYRDVPVPVLTWEFGIYDDMGMVQSGTNLGTATLNAVTINTDANHPIAGGLTGSQSIYSASVAGVPYGIIGPGGVTVAAVPGTNPIQSAIFVYDAGAGMFGLNAPARRVGFALGDNSATQQTSAGKAMLAFAISWAIGFSAPIITLQPENKLGSVGHSVTFSVVASGGGLAYQWRTHISLNFINDIPGATSATYTHPVSGSGENGMVFSCRIRNTSGTVISNEVTLRLDASLNLFTANKITATQLVTTPQWEIPDYVFEKDYRLRTLPDLERYLAEHKHLPDMPGAAEIKLRGMNMGEMNIKLLKNLEELTLQVIGLRKEMKATDRWHSRQVDSLRILLKNR